MDYQVLSDDEFLHKFEQTGISNEDFSHENHIRVAYLYMLENDFDEACKLIKHGIKKLNQANRVPETKIRGYHETMTMAWLAIVKAAIMDSKTSSFKQKPFSEFIKTHQGLLNPRLLQNYYSSDRLLSVDAKRQFLQADIKPLPWPPN